MKVNESLLGINNSKSHIGEMCCLPIKSLNENFSTKIFCFVLPNITDDVPSQQIILKDLNLPSNLCLADPNFHTPSSVDLIIGADVFWDLLGLRKISLGAGKPVLFESSLGWLVSGPLYNSGQARSTSDFKSNFVSVKSNNNVSSCNDSSDDIQTLLTRFWRLEEVSPQSSSFSEEEKMCEEHFIKNTSRQADGRFCVRLPLTQSPDVLGGSLQRAEHCLLSLERKFKGQSEFKNNYIEFMSEYLSLGHMSECSFDSQRQAYFIPHHSLNLNIGSTEPCKTLGLSWLIESDDLHFSTNNIKLNKLTKRGLLSVISQIFDPLGLLAPCIISMKILMQKLWLLKLSWDDPLPIEIIKSWQIIADSLPLLSSLRIPRLILCNSYDSIDLHIFCDASQSAYGACLYVRSTNDNVVLVRLLSAKSRVAPIKPTTIPRLELCAALVGVCLYEKVLRSLRVQNKRLPAKNHLLKFNPFLDNNKLMRVGGRLGNSLFSYEKKHPILLQSTHHLTKILFKYMHVKLLHAGPRLLLTSIRETYWPIGGLNLAKRTFRNCHLCCRFKGKVVNPIMGNLPQRRVTASGYPFETVGIDYAGPIMSASRQGRGCKLVKVYIIVFVCFVTKAMHIELVGDLTSNNFLSALRRFMSRRGKPKHIYSDNGTSFVGAYNEIGRFIKSCNNSLPGDLAPEGINFHFLPPHAPHFGGLWEAGVKSVKFHLKRILGNCNLTYEELNTVLVQIEAVLNSRPLTPLSADPSDLLPLTPGHFLIGRPLTALPTDCYERHVTGTLSRYQHLEQLRQHFWRRWSKEYISELQLRTKWRSDLNPLQEGVLVILKEDNLPPLKWRLGRVVAVHPGADGVSRVADVRTATGVVRRAFSKICPLPQDDI
ncbi:uncharacterized protein LOC123721177 isoform X2 [Papilio machaon]|uniref:uncharacterized protein LOC123721177 isoform X2 n=1 Tax=Papilio machaon TaxID=76193 RepID=UPI001E6661DE|nr:uncharacterized protein LOC123721177 isoform X2 [Papilio machaon]